MGQETEATLPASAHGSVDDRIDRSFATGVIAGGRYKIERFVASGAMGEVYAARDLVLGGPVALKALRAELAGSTIAIERLRREISLARKVSNPHICRLHDVGEHDARVFLTMELLDGRTLSDHVKATGALASDAVDRLAGHMVDGLAALHGAGIIHRDFKTANVILVGADPATARAVITDFGLARSIEVDRDASLTAEASLLGTPAYMAPEQVEGRPATPASDIYGLGVVLFELLTGELPFREDTAMATATARLHKPPPLPSAVRAGVPPRWDAIVLRCLERDPEARFARVEDVLGEVGYPRRRRRRRRIALAAVASGLAVAGGATAIAVSRDDDTVAAGAKGDCAPAASKLAGVWDDAVRARIGVPFLASDREPVEASWANHTRQFDDYSAEWAKSWDAACAAGDRVSDPLLYGQRLSCLDERLRDLGAYVGGMADPAIDVSEFTLGDPGEFPLAGVADCNRTEHLRAQVAPPPVAVRAEVEQLMAEVTKVRADIRLGVADEDTGFARLAEIQARVLELGYPAGSGEIAYYRAMLGGPDGERVAADMVALAEQTRDDDMLLKALTLQILLGSRRLAYDVETGDAILARATAVAARLGDPGNADLAEARVFHARRSRRRDELIAAHQAEVDVSAPEPGQRPSVWHLWKRTELVLARSNHAERAAAATEARAILVAHEAATGGWNIAFAHALRDLAPVLAAGGDLAAALAAAERSVAIYERAGAGPVPHLEESHEAAFAYSLALGQTDAADRHARAVIDHAVAVGASGSEGWLELATRAARAGQLANADHVIALAGGEPDATVEDRARLAVVALEVRLAAGDPPGDGWADRLAALPDADRHAGLAVVDARGQRAASALAHAEAIGDPHRRAIVRGRVLLELGRAAEAVVELDAARAGFAAAVGWANPRRAEVNLWLGLARIAAGDPGAALDALEAAMWGRHHVAAVEAEFALARALWASGGDRAAARAHATEAHAELAAMGERMAARARAVATWLADHPP